MKSRENRGKKLRLVEIPRKLGEENVNNYNPPILMMTKANMDIQYVHDPSFALLHYICKYVSKSESDNTEELNRVVESSDSYCSKLRKVCFAQFRQREVGTIEAVDTILGFPLRGLSDPVAWIGLGSSKETRKRRMKSLKAIKAEAAGNPQSQDVVVPNLVDTFYPRRHEDLEDVSLYEIVSGYDHSKQAPSARSKVPSFPCDDDNGFFVKRSKNKIPNWFRYKKSDAESVEKNARTTILLFIPWRDEDAFLTEQYPTWTALYSSPEIQQKLKERAGTVLAAVKIMEENEEQRLKWEAQAKEQAENLQDLSPEEAAAAEERSAETGVGFVADHEVASDLCRRLEQMQKNCEQWNYLTHILDHLEHQELHKKFACTFFV